MLTLTIRTIMTSTLFIFPIMGYAQDTFNILIQRVSTENGLITGKILVNGTEIGQAYENADLKIPAGSYRGYLRYCSQQGHAQGPGGSMTNTGDFLLEVGGVSGRTNILFHGGTKPQHSKGCILLGPVHKHPSDGSRYLDEDSPLRRLRLMFYGTDEPNSSPNVRIVITIQEA